MQTGSKAARGSIQTQMRTNFKEEIRGQDKMQTNFTEIRGQNKMRTDQAIRGITSVDPKIKESTPHHPTRPPEDKCY